MGFVLAREAFDPTGVAVLAAVNVHEVRRAFNNRGDMQS